MKYFLMSLILMFQVHCATVNPRLAYNKDKQSLMNVCNAMFKDSGLDPQSHKKEYQLCLQNQFSSLKDSQNVNRISTGIFSYLALMLSAAILSTVSSLP